MIHGTGDAFASGFLYGISQNISLPASGKLAALTAAEILKHWGGRPETSLADKFKDYLASVKP